MGKMYASYEAMLSLYAELILDEAIRKHREKHLYQEIDDALANRDEQTFLELTNELRMLIAHSEHAAGIRRTSA
ncbi:IDEAL domain-containing protein [Gorillibacterium sp. sgz5001074]|uniref:IDEAL domain-containing protein n=1 Tax=Gorillibacterium sp. sgz5001074 TaxID=3446695 RepID=UPI003F6779A1